MKVIKRFLSAMLPARIYDWIQFLRCKNRNILRDNIIWKNSGDGRRAWILATGPSIRQQDLSLLDGEDCFSVSNFFLHHQIRDIKPKAHFFAPYHEPLLRENYLEWLAEADSILPDSTAVVLGLADRTMIEDSGIFSNRKKYYLAMGGRKFSDIDCKKIVPGIQTGPQMIISLLIYAGYKEIYLLGCDHNTLKDYGGVVENFYSPDKERRINATSGDGWLPIIDHLQTQINVFRIYEKFAEQNPLIKIYNCSPSSWLRFTRLRTMNFESAVALKHTPNSPNEH